MADPFKASLFPVFINLLHLKQSSAVALFLSLSASVYANATPGAGDTTYIWVSNGANPEDFSGTITMNSPSTPSSGTIETNIVSLSVANSVYGTFNVSIPGNGVPFPGGIDQFTSLTWTPTTLSPDMVLDNGIEWQLLSYQMSTYNGAQLVTDSGSWQVEAVPEPSSMLLFGSGLAVVGRLIRKTVV